MTSISSNSYASQYASQSAAQARQALFKKLDSNGDGVASSDELTSALSSQFGSSDATSLSASFLKALDQDSSGGLSYDEFSGRFSGSTSSALLQAQEQAGGVGGGGRPQGPPPGPPPSAQDFLSNADSDGDGSLSESEFAEAAPDGVSSDKSKQIFDSLDTNQDGKVSLDELQAADKKRAENSQSGSQAVGGPPPGAPPGPPPSAQDLLSKADSDGDGSLSATEFADAAPQGVSSEQSKKLFDALDTNQDGKVSLDELQAADKKRAEQSGTSTTASSQTTTDQTANDQSAEQFLSSFANFTQSGSSSTSARLASDVLQLLLQSAQTAKAA